MKTPEEDEKDTLSEEPSDKSNQRPVKLGVLEGKCTYRIKDGFKMTDEEFLES